MLILSILAAAAALGAWFLAAAAIGYAFAGALWLACGRPKPRR